MLRAAALESEERERERERYAYQKSPIKEPYYTQKRPTDICIPQGASEGEAGDTRGG